jgi:hypothetical protein
MMYDHKHHLDVFESGGTYLYRGTMPTKEFVEEYFGAGVTPTSIDPLVATLFAAKCRSEGTPIVILAEREKFKARLDGPTCVTWANVELAVNIEIPPWDFEREAARIISLETSLQIFDQLGIELPTGLVGSGAVRQALFSSPRLTFEQRERYARLAMEVKDE